MGVQTRIVEAQATPYRLALARPWVTARGERRERSGWRINLQTADGRVGVGDCAPLPEAGTESETVAAQTLDAALAASRGMVCDSLLARLDDWRDAPALRCALETALLDLAAQRAGLPLARCLNPEAPARVAVNAVIGSLDEDIAGRAGAALGAGFQVLKLKVGVYPPAREVESLNALAGALPTGALLRLDANGAWDEAVATAFVDAVRALPLDALEEPLRAPDPAALARLQARVPWPLALDESLAVQWGDAHSNPLSLERESQEPIEALPLPLGEGRGEGGKKANPVSWCGVPHPDLFPGEGVVKAVLQAPSPCQGEGWDGGSDCEINAIASFYPHPDPPPARGTGLLPHPPGGRRDRIASFFCSTRRLVLKPTVLGGLLPALGLARQAQAAGLECVVTSSLESAPGLWAVAHLAAAIDSGLAHGLATADLLQGDMMRGAPRPESGGLALPGLPGLGWEG